LHAEVWEWFKPIKAHEKPIQKLLYESLGEEIVARWTEEHLQNLVATKNLKEVDKSLFKETKLEVLNFFKQVEDVKAEPEEVESRIARMIENKEVQDAITCYQIINYCHVRQKLDDLQALLLSCYVGTANTFKSKKFKDAQQEGQMDALKEGLKYALGLAVKGTGLFTLLASAFAIGFGAKALFPFIESLSQSEPMRYKAFKEDVGQRSDELETKFFNDAYIQGWEAFFDEA